MAPFFPSPSNLSNPEDPALTEGKEDVIVET
jgi:hypothetical protein